MTAPVTSASVLWSAVLHSTAGNIPLGYALTKSSDGRGFVVATTANLAASASGRIHGVPLTTGSYPGSVQIQQDGIVEPAYLPFVGVGNSTDYANVNSLGRVVRSASFSSGSTIGVCGADGSVKLDGTTSIISGDASARETASVLADGDVVCSAADPEL